MNMTTSQILSLLNEKGLISGFSTEDRIEATAFQIVCPDLEYNPQNIEGYYEWFKDNFVKTTFEALMERHQIPINTYDALYQAPYYNGLMRELKLTLDETTGIMYIYRLDY